MVGLQRGAPQNKRRTRRRNISAESSELQEHFHLSPHLLPSADKHYCSVSLQVITEQPLLQQGRLRRVRTARAALLRDGRSQQTIRQYMTPDAATTLEQTIPSPRMQPLTTATGRTLQSRLNNVWLTTSRADHQIQNLGNLEILCLTFRGGPRLGTSWTHENESYKG